MSSSGRRPRVARGKPGIGSQGTGRPNAGRPEGVVLIGDSEAELSLSAASIDGLAAPVASAQQREKLARLTRREREVLGLIAQGLTARQTAHTLGISPKTVEQHKGRIFAKLGVPNQVAAVGLAIAASVEQGPDEATRRDPPAGSVGPRAPNALQNRR